MQAFSIKVTWFRTYVIYKNCTRKPLIILPTRLIKIIMLQRFLISSKVLKQILKASLEILTLSFRCHASIHCKAKVYHHGNIILEETDQRLTEYSQFIICENCDSLQIKDYRKWRGEIWKREVLVNVYLRSTVSSYGKGVMNRELPTNSQIMNEVSM